MEEKQFKRVLFEASVLAFLNGIGVNSTPSSDGMNILYEKFWGSSDEFMATYRFVLGETEVSFEKVIDYLIHEDIGAMRINNLIKKYDGLERKTLEKAMKELNDEVCATLWNDFLEDSGKYGECNHAFDLHDKTDIDILTENGTIKNSQVLKEMIAAHDRFIYFPNGEVKPFKGKEMIATYWGDIFERVLLYPHLYCNNGTYGLTDNVFVPCMAEMLGYEIDDKNYEVRKKKKD